MLNHIGEALSYIGKTDFETRTRNADSTSTAAVVIFTRRWEDIVTLGLIEIREYGAKSVQVTRRLRALLDELLATVRPEHRAALEDELRRLDATVAVAWGDSIDLDRADAGDRQGVGGMTQDPELPG